MAAQKRISICPQCGVTFSSRPALKQKFCSPLCHHNARRRPHTERVADWLKQFTDPIPCWEWDGARGRHGYGRIAVSMSRRSRVVHRVAWEVTHGAIPDDLNVLHRCDNPPCCNPHHLFLGTQADNVLDMVNKGRESRGTARWNAKLTAEDVRAIRASSGSIRVAEHYGISWLHLEDIMSRRRWKWLK